MARRSAGLVFFGRKQDALPAALDVSVTLFGRVCLRAAGDLTCENVEALLIGRIGFCTSFVKLPSYTDAQLFESKSDLRPLRRKAGLAWIYSDMRQMWPMDFARIPANEPWVGGPIDELARRYDDVEEHGWYRNLDPIMDDLQDVVQEGDIVIDYSAGTGILVEQFMKRMPDLQAAYLLVDASPKFLRLALEKLGSDERTAFRWIRYLKDEKRLQSLDEVLPEAMGHGGVDALCSTNAIHLYGELGGTLRSWAQALKAGGVALIQSGNIANPNAPGEAWIIDDTVTALQPVARDLVREDEAYASFRQQLDDADRTAAYDALRKKYFLPVRPLSFYLDSFRAAGFEIVNVYERPIAAKVSDWAEFLAAYHEGVLGWAGGSKRVEGTDPSEECVALRQRLLRESLARLFNGRSSFETCWTYLKCRRLSPNGA